MKIKNLFICFFAYLVVITNPYEGINYDAVNVYHVNWCNYHCPGYNKEEPESRFPWRLEIEETNSPFVYYSEGWNDYENNQELQMQSKDKKRRNFFNFNDTSSYLQIFQSGK